MLEEARSGRRPEVEVVVLDALARRAARDGDAVRARSLLVAADELVASGSPTVDETEPGSPGS